MSRFRDWLSGLLKRGSKQIDADQTKKHPSWGSSQPMMAGDRETKSKKSVGEKVMIVVIAIVFAVLIGFIGWILLDVYGPK